MLEEIGKRRREREWMEDNKKKATEITLTDTNEIHLHTTKESALRESRTRIQNLTGRGNTIKQYMEE